MAEPITFFERPNVAAWNLLHLDPLAAGQALVSPDSLPPSKRRRFIESDGLLGELASIVTNPLFLLGLAAHVRFPIASAADQMRFKEKFLDWTHGMGIVGKQLSSTQASLLGTQLSPEDKIRYGMVDANGEPYSSQTIVDLFQNVLGNQKAFKDKYAVRANRLYDEYLKRKGVKEISPHDNALVGAYMDGLWRQNKGTNAAWGPSAEFRQLLGLQPENYSIVSADLPDWMARNRPEELALAENFRGLYKEMFEEAFGTTPKQTVLKALSKRAKQDMGIRYTHGMDDQQIDQFLRSVNIDPSLSGIKKALDRVGLSNVGGSTYEDLARNLTKMHPKLGLRVFDERAAKTLAARLAEKGLMGDVLQVDWYHPHLAPRDRQGWQDFTEQMMEAANWRTAVKAEMDTAGMGNKLSAHAKRRRSRMAPSNPDLALLDELGLVTPEAKAVLWGTAGRPDVKAQLAAKMGVGIDEIPDLMGRSYYEYDLELNILDQAAQGSPDRSAFLGRAQAAGDALLSDLGFEAKDRKKILQTIIDEGEPGPQEIMRRLRSFVADKAPSAATSQYSLMSLPVMSRYIHNVGVQKAWLTDGFGDISYGQMIMEQAEKAGGPLQNMVQETMVPLAQGRLTASGSIQSLEWVEARNRMLDKLDNPDHWVNRLPGGVSSWLRKRLVNYAGPMTWGQFGGHLAGLFYNSTLGLNPASALKNTLQTVITTGPMIGFRHLFAGQRETARRIGDYVQMRAKHGHDVAFEGAFGDFIDAGLDPHPAAEAMLSGFVDEAYRSSATEKLAMAGHRAEKYWRGVQDKMLALFQKSEQFNRMSTFYGGIHKWNADMEATGLGHKVLPKIPRGIEGTDAIGDLYMLRMEGSPHAAEGAQYARNLVNMTQFPAGPGQTPHALREWAAPLRQFMHFPLRYLEFLNLSTMQPWGQGRFAAQAGGLGGLVGVPLGSERNLGTLGRVLMGSTVAAGLGKSLLNTDLSSGLMTGALPLPAWEGSPFYPLPFVPPLVGLAGAAAMDLTSGEFDQTKRSLPLLVPGGVALSRYSRYAPLSLGGRADYNNRTPDGRVPVYTETGSLKGYMTPMQLFGASIGLKPLNMEKEQALMGYLVQQRDKIREYRRNYLEAVSVNDWQEAEDIKRQFREEFPDLGELKIKKQDLEAVKSRRQITRLERLMDTLPREYRDEYGQMVSMALGQEAQGLLGVDPALLGQPGTTARSRPRQFPGMFSGLNTTNLAPGNPTEQVSSSPAQPGASPFQPSSAQVGAFGSFGSF